MAYFMGYPLLKYDPRNYPRKNTLRGVELSMNYLDRRWCLGNALYDVLPEHLEILYQLH